jgi:phosphate regulon transcriptional regulator PhoB
LASDENGSDMKNGPEIKEKTMTIIRRRGLEPAPPGPGQRVGRVLVVEDEQDVAEMIRYNISKEGYDVAVVKNGADAIERARELRPDVVLLDIMIPQLNGWEVCRRLKQEPRTRAIPVIMVTGRVEEGDKILGFEMGADDYITKPFSPRELVARIRAVVRRGAPITPQDRKHLKAGELEIDRYRFEVRMKGQPVELTPKEFELLAALVGTPGRVFGREELLDLVWGTDGFVEPRTVDVHVARLRGKFTAARLPVPAIETVRGVGYRFREEAGAGAIGA